LESVCHCPKVIPLSGAFCINMYLQVNRRDFAGTVNINPNQYTRIGEIRAEIGNIITIRPEQYVSFRGTTSAEIDRYKTIEKTEPTEVRSQAIVSKEPDEDSDDKLWQFLCKSLHFVGALINVILDTYQVCSFT
jgi:hypothetical protein